MVETSSSASLIAQANKFMDAIAEPMRLDEVLQTIDELERFQRLTVDREIRMAELKQEIEKMRAKLESSGINPNS